MQILGIISGIVLVAVVFFPFIWGDSGFLVSAASENSPQRLREMQMTILQRYLADEQSYLRQEISARSWQQRRQFLINRYVDFARRLDFLQFMARNSPAVEETNRF